MGRTIIVTIAVICAVFVLSSLVGCATTGPDLTPRSTWCDFNKPRRDATDSTPRAELDEINSHNRLGAAICGWKP